MSGEFTVLGKRLPRNDAIEKVKGEAKFIPDIKLPEMLYAKTLRSPHAHARIIRIDTDKAEALPGVKGVLTCKNVPRIHPGDKLEYLLDEILHCAGEEVAVVAAVSTEVAEEALKLIDVEYEVLPAVFDAEEAMKPDAPLVYSEYGTNMYHGTETHPVPRCQPDGWLKLEVGNPEKGFAEADYIVEGTYETPIQCPCSPMPRSVVCQWVGDQLICWADTQKPMAVRRILSKNLGMPLSSIRVIATHSVGGYGGKEPGKTGTLVSILSKRTGRPVRALFTREEDFIATHRRLSYKAYEKIGVKKDGTITAMHHKMITNFGRDSTEGRGFQIPAGSAVATCSILYPCPNSTWEGCTVITNTEEHGGVNGWGDPEAGFCLERIIDEAAEKIGMDPVEFRLKNCARYGTRGLGWREVMGFNDRGLPLPPGPLEWGVLGKDLDSLQQCIRAVAERAQWKKKWKGWKTPVEVNGPKRKGIGVAIGLHQSAYHLAAATVQMNQDGTANVMSSFVEMGSGCKTAMAQVVAETLGLHYEDINVILADTAVTPAGFGNIGSGGTSSGIAAAKHAADDVRQTLFNIAAERLGGEAEPEGLEAKNRRIHIKGNPERGISIAEVCWIGYQVTSTSTNPPLEWMIDEKTGKVIYPYAVAATIAEVEVDTETGELNVLGIASAHDCGRAINPTIVENQIDLSMTMSNGWVRSESFVIDESTGAMMNSNLLDYKIMTILDMPKRDDIQEIIVEVPCAWGPFGAKGMAETATTTPAPTLANAIYNAIGVRIRGDHLTPDRILEALGR